MAPSSGVPRTYTPTEKEECPQKEHGPQRKKWGPHFKKGKWVHKVRNGSVSRRVMSSLAPLTVHERVIFEGAVDDLSDQVSSVPDSGDDPETEVWAETDGEKMTLHSRRAESARINPTLAHVRLMGTLTEIVIARPSPAFMLVFTGPSTIVAKVTHNPLQSTAVPRNDLEPFRTLPVLASVVTVLPPADDRTSRVLEALQWWQSATSTPFTTPRFDVAKSKLKPTKPRSVLLEGGNVRVYSSVLPATFPQSGRKLPDGFAAASETPTPTWLWPLVAGLVAVVVVSLGGLFGYKYLKSKKRAPGRTRR